MKRLRVTHDIIGMSNFRSNLKTFIETVREEKRPLVVSIDSDPFAVVIPPEEFDEFLEYKEWKKTQHKKAV